MTGAMIWRVANSVTSVIFEDDLSSKYHGEIPDGKILVNDRIADAMFQQALLRPQEYDVLAMPNLNGDYMSDAASRASWRV